MPKIILKESELIRIIEVAMDLDIYSQPSTVDTNNGNQDEEETIEQIIEKMKEILYMLKDIKRHLQLQFMKTVSSDICL